MKKEIKVTENDNLDSIVYTLLACKARGEEAYCDFYGHLLESDYISMDTAYKKVYGLYKEEYKQQQRMKEYTYNRGKAINTISEEDYHRILDSKKDNEPIITKEKVISGIKYIIENQSLDQEELINGLIERKCNFTIDDVAKQFSERITVKDGIKEGNIACGALVIINMRDSEHGRIYCTDNFLRNDDEYSLYHYIRLLTNDNNYTKENILGLEEHKHY